MKINGDKGLAKLKVRGHALADSCAESARGAFITGGTQILVYLERKAEAAAFLAHAATPGAPVEASDWPYLNAELGITGATLFDVATAITKAAAVTSAKLAATERVRLLAHKAVEAAGSPGEVASAISAAYPAP